MPDRPRAGLGLQPAAARGWLAVLVAALTLLGCVPDPDVEPPTCRNPKPAVAEIGNGDLASGFSPKADGAKALATLGAQGLHMITVSVKFTDFEMPPAGTSVSTLWLSIYNDGKLLGAVPQKEKPRFIDAHTVVFLGLRPTLTADDAEAYFGKLSEVEVSIRDGCDRLIRVRKPVVIYK